MNQNKSSPIIISSVFSLTLSSSSSKTSPSLKHCHFHSSLPLVQLDRYCAHLWTVGIPKFSEWRSASTFRVHMCLDHLPVPQRTKHKVWSTLEWFRLPSHHKKCQNIRSLLVSIISDTEVCPMHLKLLHW